MNYVNDIYEESFHDTLRSFDEYVQESALLIGGIVAGVVAFVALIILLIKKIFFSKKEGSESISSILTKLNMSLKKNGIPERITLPKGVNLEKLASVVSMIDAALVIIRDKGIDANADDKNLNTLITATSISENDVFTDGNWTVSTIELRQWVDTMIKLLKDVANNVKVLDKKYQSGGKGEENVSDENKKILTRALKAFTENLTKQKDIYQKFANMVRTEIGK